MIGALLSGCATANATTKVNINTNVDGAKVVVDGRILGQTPINSVEIKNSSGARNYPVIIEKEGYKIYHGNLEQEDKMGAIVAVIIGYSFCWLLLPALLLFNAQYVRGPVPDQYFYLEAAD